LPFVRFPGPRLLTSCACGVVQPFSNKPETLADVRRADARSAEIDSPDGVSRCFHVSVYSVEPSEAVLARNLLAKDDWRRALADEPIEFRPQVAFVFEAFALARRTERLAGARAGPGGTVIGPSGEAKGVGPSAQACEEMALCEASEVIRGNISN
jgi:hypothetical protein